MQVKWRNYEFNLTRKCILNMQNMIKYWELNQYRLMMLS